MLPENTGKDDDGIIMRLFDGVYLVGSGELGISDDFDCHIYLVDCGEKAFVIDSGAGRDPARVLANIQKYLPLTKIDRVLLTHVHADHSGGTPGFQEKGIKVYAPDGEVRAMREKPGDMREAFRLAKNSGSYPDGYEYPFVEPDGEVSDGDTILIGDKTVTALHYGGHSEGLLCYLVEIDGKRVLFSSDYVFAGGRIGLLNCPGSDLAAYRRDIKKLAGLAIDILLPGHRMFVLDNGQRHIERAIASLDKAFVPATF